MLQENTFDDDLWAQIRKDFGDHLMRQREFIKARENFEESLKFQPDKLDSVYRLASSQAREAQVDEALANLKSRSRLDSYKNHFKCNLQECDCHYESNDFEQNILCLNDRIAKYRDETIEVPQCGPLTLKKLNDAKPMGPKLSVLNKRFNTVITNYEDTIGKNAGECLWNQRKYFDKILNRWKPNLEIVDASPKVLKGDDPCILMSDKSYIPAHKLDVKERHRIAEVKRKFAQGYMQSAYKDYIFINELKTNEILKRSTQNASSFSKINLFIDECIRGTSALIEQLHARCPLYTKDHQVFLDEKQHEKACNMRSFRSRHRLCRGMFTAISEMERWRGEGKLENLIKVAEHELGERFRVHSNKLIPRKNEFIVKICNYIALSHIDKLLNQKVPEDESDDYKSLGKLFGLKTSSSNARVTYIFGDQSTYKDPTETETHISFLAFKKNMSHFEERIAQKPMLKIEKCHLLYEMGRANLKQHLIDEARNFGRRVIETAKDVSHLWSFLGYVMVVRADIKQKNFAKLLDSLNEAEKKIDVFKNEDLEGLFKDAKMLTNRLLPKE